MKQLALDLARTAPPTLHNFVAGRNAELLQSLQQAAAGETAERFFYVWGAAGSGRSHLLRGFVAAVNTAGGRAAYVAGAGGAGIAADFEQVDCVAVDDVQCLDERAQAGLFHLYNALRERGGALLAGGDTPPAQLGLRQDLVTRLAWGLIYQVHALSDGEKAQALQDHAAARGFRLPDEVCAYLLARVQRDMPALLTMLDALDRYSLETKRQITVPLARELLHATPRAQQADVKNG